MQENATTEEQIDAITEIIFDEYEKPGTDTKDRRKSSAQLWYTVMTGEYGNEEQ